MICAINSFQNFVFILRTHPVYERIQYYIVQIFFIKKKFVPYRLSKNPPHSLFVSIIILYICIPYWYINSYMHRSAHAFFLSVTTTMMAMIIIDMTYPLTTFFFLFIYGGAIDGGPLLISIQSPKEFSSLMFFFIVCVLSSADTITNIDEHCVFIYCPCYMH